MILVLIVGIGFAYLFWLGSIFDLFNCWWTKRYSIRILRWWHKLQIWRRRSFISRQWFLLLSILHILWIWMFEILTQILLRITWDFSKVLDDCFWIKFEMVLVLIVFVSFSSDAFAHKGLYIRLSYIWLWLNNCFDNIFFKLLGAWNEIRYLNNLIFDIFFWTRFLLRDLLDFFFLFVFGF